MSSFNKYNNRLSTSKKPSNGKRYLTKGERLGWKPLSETKVVKLENELSEGEVVVLKQDNKPLLVP
jgi:hypothetical protein